jgi:TRAP-type C4-dicarboxylate transport system substrate-binding protein
VAATCYDPYSDALRHRHITLSGHFFGAAVLLCHQDSYHRWPVDVQHAVAQAATEATRAQRQFAAAEDDEVMRKLDPAQNEIVHLTETKRTRFVHALAPLVNAQRAIFGDKLFCYLA